MNFKEVVQLLAVIVIGAFSILYVFEKPDLTKFQKVIQASILFACISIVVLGIIELRFMYLEYIGDEIIRGGGE